LKLKINMSDINKVKFEFEDEMARPQKAPEIVVLKKKSSKKRGK